MYFRDLERHINTRDFRAHMSTHMNEGHAFSIGGTWDIRAIVIPFPDPFPRAASERRAVMARIRRAFKERLAEILTHMN